jgi:hypothetical protein
VKPVKNIDLSPNNISGTGWRLLGELELPVLAQDDGAVSAWLTETLNPLNMHADFLNNVLKSAQDAAGRAIQSEKAQLNFEHIHLLVFLPATPASNRQTWGFFRIEKLERPEQHKSSPDHAIEFYLYLEGQ